MRKSAPPFLLHSTFPVNFAVTASIRGNFSIEQLNAAFAKVRQKHPMLGVHVVTDQDGAWYETEGAPDFLVRTIDGDWVPALEEELNKPFDARIGLVRFVVAREGDHTHLIMVCQHAIADGLSAAYVLRDILFYMAHPDSIAEPLPDCPTMDDILPPVDLETMDFSGPSRQQSDKFGAKDHEQLSLFVIPSSLTEMQTTTLIARCKQERTSVHAALCVAFLTAIERLEADEQSAPRILSSPVNLRDRFSPPIGEQFGIYISPGVKTCLDCSNGRDFWDMAREFKAALTHDMAGDKAYKTLYFFRYISMRAAKDKNFKFMEGRRFADYDMSITNLGRLDFPVEYGTLRLEAIYGPAVNPLGREKVMGVTTVGNKLTFTFVAPYQLIDRPVAKQLIEMAKQELANATR